MGQISQVLRLKTSKLFNIWLPLLLVMVTGGLLILIMFSVSAYQLLYLNKVYPGVWVDGLPVGGMTPTEVATAVSSLSSPKLTQALTIQTGDQSWTFTGLELGLRVDGTATANKAYAVGRQGNLLADMITQLSLMTAPRQVEPVIRHDSGPLNQTLQTIAKEVDFPPQNARLIVHPEARVEVIPGRRGRRLHLEGTSDLIKTALLSDADQPVTAIVQAVVPPITEAEVAVARRQVENLLSQPLTFAANSDDSGVQWHLEPQTLVDLIDLVETVDSRDKTVLTMTFDRAGFGSIFEEFAKTIKTEAGDARLEIDPETGELTVLQPSREGRALDMEATYQQLAELEERLKERPAPLVQLPLVLSPPAVSSQDVDSLGIKELISESTSYFKGSSQGRVHNIALAASKFHGVVVPPGQIFSFNEHLGQVTKESGYDESLIIFGNRTTVGIGGGVCQVSTTAFRTAFFGGFEIVERWAHGYRVGWYETKAGPGLDATIYTPDVDLRFRNDTEHYLLIQTETDKAAGTLTFRFYGTDPDREIIVSEPEVTNLVEHGPPIYEEDPTLPKGTTKQVDWAQDGMDVTITRTVKAGDLILHKDLLQSHYRPWQAVYKVGAAEKDTDKGSSQPDLTD